MVETPRSLTTFSSPSALMAVLAGASGPTSIAKWAAIKEEFLLSVLDLPNGIPRKDVFRRVLMALQPGAFQACFGNWLTSLRATAATATSVEQPILAVDGKTARRSHDRKKGVGALHSVSVWASEFGLSLGQVACAEKSNEITAIPELLRLVDIKGTIITIDAMGTQKAIAAQIIDGEANSVRHTACSSAASGLGEPISGFSCPFGTLSAVLAPGSLFCCHYGSWALGTANGSQTNSSDQRKRSQGP